MGVTQTDISCFRYDEFLDSRTRRELSIARDGRSAFHSLLSKGVQNGYLCTRYGPPSLRDSLSQPLALTRLSKAPVRSKNGKKDWASQRMGHRLFMKLRLAFKRFVSSLRSTRRCRKIRVLEYKRCQ